MIPDFRSIHMRKSFFDKPTREDQYLTNQIFSSWILFLGIIVDRIGLHSRHTTDGNSAASDDTMKHREWFRQTKGHDRGFVVSLTLCSVSQITSAIIKPRDHAATNVSTSMYLLPSIFVHIPKIYKSKCVLVVSTLYCCAIHNNDIRTLFVWPSELRAITD